MTNLDQILLDRSVKYGSFTDVANRTSRIFHAIYCNAPEFGNKSVTPLHSEALHMIAYKIARLVNGRINDLDSWRDIAGYAMLVHRHIKESQETRAADSAFANNTAVAEMESGIAKLAQEMSAEQA